jgi:hypothetical protein
MADSLENILEAHLRHLRKVNAMMTTGTMTTRTEGSDSTLETVEENARLIFELEAALNRHLARNA